MEVVVGLFLPKQFTTPSELVSYTAVFSVVTQSSSPHDTKNGCVADYFRARHIKFAGHLARVGGGGGKLGYFLVGMCRPGLSPNRHPVLKKNSPKIDTPF